MTQFTMAIISTEKQTMAISTEKQTFLRFPVLTKIVVNNISHVIITTIVSHQIFAS